MNMRDRVGWRVNRSLIDMINVTYDIRLAPYGHLPVLVNVYRYQKWMLVSGYGDCGVLSTFLFSVLGKL